jgi:hypothetical protein
VFLPLGYFFAAMIPVISAPALSETRTEGGYRMCSIARSTCEDYRDMYDYPAEGTPNSCFGGARRPASPADPVPPVEHHGLRPGAQTALLDGQPVCESHAPAEQRRSRQLCL